MGKSWSRSCSSKHTNGDNVDFKRLSKTTNFSSRQLKMWHGEFLKYCPDGQMTKEVFMESFGEFFFPNDLNVNRLAEYIFKRFDTNKDGVISFSEFISAVAIPSQGSVDEKLDWAFSVYDIDDDGFITQEEMLKIVGAVYEKKGLMDTKEFTAAKEKVEGIFRKMDSNGDGRLSRDEFIEGFKSDPIIIRSLLSKSGDEL